MKTTIILITFLLFNSVANSQSKKDTIFYLENWERTTDRSKAFIYGLKNYNKKKTGLAKYYWVNDGTLHSEQNEKKDKKQGLCTWYYRNGSKLAEGTYKKDVESGRLDWFTASNQRYKVQFYKKGKLEHTKHGKVSLEASSNIAGSDDTVIEFPEYIAEFNGGISAMFEYIQQNVNYPSQAIKNNDQGKVYIQFIVEANGEVTEVKVERGVSTELDIEAKRVITNMPLWIPAIENGNTVRCRCRIPIAFTLD